MTRSEIDAVLERVKTWPLERQEDAAAVLLRMEEVGTELYELSDEERADIVEGLAEAERGEFASQEEVDALLARYR